MPLQRYDKGDTPFRQVSPVGYQAQSQGLSNLSDKLSQWQNFMYERGAEVVAEEGRDQAIKDMASGDPLKIEKGYGFYAKAYNKISTAAYNVQVESDLKKKAEELALQDPLNHEKFSEVFTAYSKTMVDSIKEPEFKAIMLQNAQKIGATKSSEIAKKAFENTRKNQLEVLNTGLSEAEKSYSASFASNDNVMATDSLAKYTALLENFVAAGEMDEGMIPYKIKELQKKAIVNKVKLEMDNSIEAGETDFIDRFTQSDTYLKMDATERKEIMKDLYDMTDQRYKAERASFEGNNKMIEAMSKTNTAKTAKRMYLGEKIPESELDNMLRENKIDSSAYLELKQLQNSLQAGASSDDYQTVLYYEQRVEFEKPSNVANDSRLTAKTKSDLIRRIINHQETVRGNNALANGFKEQRQMYGKTSWQMSSEYINANIFADDPDSEKKKRVDVMNKVRDAVSKGLVSPLDVHDYTIELVDKQNAKEKDASLSRKYDTEVNKYNEDLRKWKQKSDSAIGKMFGAGDKPEAPKKPANYIAKDKR